MFPFTKSNATLSKQFLLLQQRKKSFFNMFQLSSHSGDDWRSNGEFNKVLSLRKLVNDAEPSLEEARVHYHDFQKRSWWRNYVFASPRRRRAYLKQRHEVYEEVREAHRKIDSIRDTLIGYLDELSLLDHREAFVYMMQRTPEGPLADFYHAIFLLAVYRNESQERDDAEHILAQAENRFHRAAYGEYADVHQLDQLFCRARFISEFRHLFNVNPEDPIEAKQQQVRNFNEAERNLEIAKGLFALLSQHNYAPADYQLGNIDGPFAVLTSGFSHFMRAARKQYPPALAEVGHQYYRFIRAEIEVKARSEGMSDELDSFPRQFFDESFQVFAQDALLDAAFMHDNHEAKSVFDEVTKSYRKSERISDTSMTMIKGKFDGLHQAYRHREAKEFGEATTAPERTSRKPDPLRASVELHERQPNKLFTIYKSLARIVRFKVRRKDFSSAVTGKHRKRHHKHPHTTEVALPKCGAS